MLHSFLATLQDSIHIPEGTPTAAIVSAVLVAFKLWDRHYGKRRDHTTSDLLTKISEELTKIKWYVRGPDGNGGLIRDVEVLKGEVVLVKSELDKVKLKMVIIPSPDDVPIKR